MLIGGERQQAVRGKTAVRRAVQQLLRIVNRLSRAYPKKRFTLDGRLVGDIGEVLVEGRYDVELFEGLRKHYDAECRDGRLVQIKATMKGSLTFPADHIPDYYLGVQIQTDGSIREVFNGPGRVIWEAVRERVKPKTNLHSVPISTLRRLQGRVAKRDKIPLRRNRRVKRAHDR